MSQKTLRWTAPDHLANDPHLAVLSPPPLTAPARSRAEFALHYAMLAPSVHNSQPWRIRVCGEPGQATSFEVYADLARDLPALDPERRQLVLSCGAAIGALRCGLSRLGFATRIELAPTSRDPQLLARIDTIDATAGTTGFLMSDRYGALAGGLVSRRTYRGPLTDREVSPDDRDDLARAARVEGAELVWVLDRARKERIAALVAEADRQQDSLVHGEVELWTSRDPRVRDGIPPASWQVSSSAAARDPLSQRDFAQGRPAPAGNEPAAGPEVARAADTHIPTVAVLATPGDSTGDWLLAGQALMHVLLTAEARGLAVGYLNQPIEAPAFRAQLAEAVGGAAREAVPQLALKVGHPAGPMPPAAPRRNAVAALQRP